VVVRVSDAERGAQVLCAKNGKKRAELAVDGEPGVFKAPATLPNCKQRHQHAPNPPGQEPGWDLVKSRTTEARFDEHAATIQAPFQHCAHLRGDLARHVGIGLVGIGLVGIGLVGADWLLGLLLDFVRKPR
jgi:hypothetical protein